MKRRLSNYFIAVFVGFMITSFLVCPVWAGKKDDTLNIATTKELENADRYFNTAREGIIFARQVYDNLLYRDPKTYEYKPLLAKSFNWVDDTTMAIELRQGVKFHNGAEMTADDVVYTLNFAANPENKVLTQRYSNWIKEVVKEGPYNATMKHE